MAPAVSDGQDGPGGGQVGGTFAMMVAERNWTTEFVKLLHAVGSCVAVNIAMAKKVTRAIFFTVESPRAKYAQGDVREFPAQWNKIGCKFLKTEQTYVYVPI